MSQAMAFASTSDQACPAGSDRCRIGAGQQQVAGIQKPIREERNRSIGVCLKCPLSDNSTSDMRHDCGRRISMIRKNQRHRRFFAGRSVPLRSNDRLSLVFLRLYRKQTHGGRRWFRQSHSRIPPSSDCGMAAVLTLAMRMSSMRRHAESRTDCARRLQPSRTAYHRSHR